MREALRSLLVALQFLTRLPVRLSAMPTPEQFGRAVLCYPLVGVLIGVVLYAAARSLDGTPPLLQAALLLSLWVALSGALHRTAWPTWRTPGSAGWATASGPWRS